MDQAVYRHGRRHRAVTSPTSWPRCARTAGRLDLDRPEGPDRQRVRPGQGRAPAASPRGRGRRHRSPARQARGYDASLFVVLKTAALHRATSDIETGEVMVFLGDRFVVTVRRGEAGPLAAVRQRIEHDADAARARARGGAARRHGRRRRQLRRHRPGDPGRPRRDRGASVFADERSSRRAGDLRAQARGPGVPPRRRAADRAGPAAVRGRRPARARTSTKPFFRDVADHLLRRSSTTSSPTTGCSPTSSSAHLAQVSVQQNDDMRKISAWVAIAAVPTAIAGIYGMNFQHMPEARLAARLPATLCS